MTMTGAAYLRCSDPRQDKSIDQQKAEILKRAEADGVVIPEDHWFVDEGISGRSTRRRASYLALIKRAEAQRDAQRGKARRGPQRIDRLYVWAFSRLARNMFDALRALAALDEADIDVVSLTEPDAGDRSFRKLIRPILAWLAERYSEELSRNVQRGMRSQAEKGLWLYGRPPFGYEVQEGRLVVTDATREDFEVVQRVFAETDTGRDGARRLAERLTREGVRPPGRADLAREVAAGSWRPKHVRQIVTSPVYCGHIVYDGEIVARDAHEAAVDDATYTRVQARRALRDRNRKAGQGNGASPLRLGEQGLLTPWLRCGSCGGRVRVWHGGRPGARTYLYYCATRVDNPAACPGISVRVEKLDRLVLDTIEARVLTPENLALLHRQTLEKLAVANVDEVAAERARLAAVVADLDGRIRRTAAQVVNGLIDEADAKVMSAPLLAQRETARLQLAALPAHREAPLPVDLDPERFRAAVSAAWSARPLEERREALAKLLRGVTLSPGEVKVEYAYCHHAPPGPP